MNEEIDNLEKISEKRLQTNKKNWSDEEVREDNKNADLSNIEDEWI